MKTHPDEPINPVNETEVGYDQSYEKPFERTFSQGGLTKREYFAGLALQGLIANPKRYTYVTKKMNPVLNPEPWSQEDATRHNAEKALYLADALIEALNKQQEKKS
ncbi:hypothetical protein BH10ACI2_BH10ACI2_00400 [soil metagenome]